MDDPGFLPARTGGLGLAWTRVCGFLNRVHSFESYRGHHKRPVRSTNINHIVMMQSQRFAVLVNF